MVKLYKRIQNKLFYKELWWFKSARKSSQDTLLYTYSLAGIKEIFPNDAEKWQQYTELKRIVLREVKEKT